MYKRQGINKDALGNARACQCAAGTISSYAPCAGRGGYDEVTGDCAGLVCTQCPAAATRDRTACAACNATQGYSVDTGECTCQANEILVETEGLNGTFAKACVACAPGTFSAWEDVTKGGAFFPGDPYTCRRCPDARMNADCTSCEEGYTLVGDAAMGPQSCVKTVYVTEAEEAFGLLSEATSVKVPNLPVSYTHLTLPTKA